MHGCMHHYAAESGAWHAASLCRDEHAESGGNGGIDSACVQSREIDMAGILGASSLDAGSEAVDHDVGTEDHVVGTEDKGMAEVGTAVATCGRRVAGKGQVMKGKGMGIDMGRINDDQQQSKEQCEAHVLPASHPGETTALDVPKFLTVSKPFG